MKKVLVISYYWPPSGGAGVQRWLKFVKYLRDYGWEPIVYTPENPEAPVIDDSLAKDVPEGLKVIKRPIWEPYTFYKKFIGQKKESRINAGFLSESEKPKFSENLSVWIRGNLFIPDARKFWIKPSIKFLSSYLRENPVDAIVSTGPPHSMHLIALKLKEKLHIPWLADFRDPWTNIDFYDELKLIGFADRKHHKQELKVLKNADKVVTVSWNWAEDFKRICQREIIIITNGYDEDDFQGPKPELDSKFSLVHIGSMNKDRNPRLLWEAIRELIEEIPEFEENLRIKLIGSVDITVFKSINENGLDSLVERIAHLPHDEVITETRKAQLLLLPLNKTPNVLGIIPGKLFEYFAARRPVLCIGPEEGDASGLVFKLNAGVTCNYPDKEKMKESLKKYFNDFKQNNLSGPENDPSKFSRRKLAGEISKELDSLIKK